MIKFEKGYNPYNKLESFDEELKKYYWVGVTYGNYPLNDDDFIEKAEFVTIEDVIAFIHHDKKTCKELNEPKVYFTLRVNEWCEKEQCYYYDEYEIHFRKKTGKIFLKEI